MGKITVGGSSKCECGAESTQFTLDGSGSKLVCDNYPMCGRKPDEAAESYWSRMKGRDVETHSTVVTIDSMFHCPKCGEASEASILPDVGDRALCLACGAYSYARRQSSTRSIEWALDERTKIIYEMRVRSAVGDFQCPICSMHVYQPQLSAVAPYKTDRRFSLETTCPKCRRRSVLLESSLWSGQWRWELKSSPEEAHYVWMCNACLPEAVEESTLGGGRETCALCGKELDRSVMKHVLPANFPERLKRFVSRMTKGTP